MQSPREWFPSIDRERERMGWNRDDHWANYRVTYSGAFSRAAMQNYLKGKRTPSLALGEEEANKMIRVLNDELRARGESRRVHYIRSEMRPGPAPQLRSIPGGKKVRRARRTGTGPDTSQSTDTGRDLRVPVALGA